jgi:hypothetical protein
MYCVDYSHSLGGTMGKFNATSVLMFKSTVHKFMTTYCLVVPVLDYKTHDYI